MALLRITNGFDRMSDLDFLGKVRYIVAEMNANIANFPVPDPPLATVSTLAADFEAAINAAASGGSYEKLVRDSKKAGLIDTMHDLSAYVLYTAKGDRLVAESSGFTIAKDPAPQPPIYKPVGIVLLDGPNAGEMQLVFSKVPGARSYMYQVTQDTSDETKWTTVCGTVRKNLFTGLESGKKYYVRVAALGTNNQVVYSDVFARVVQ